jgi:hypothetical protein
MNENDTPGVPQPYDGDCPCGQEHLDPEAIIVDYAADIGIAEVRIPDAAPEDVPLEMANAWQRLLQGVEHPIIERLVAQAIATHIVRVEPEDPEYLTVTGPRWLLDALFREARRRATQPAPAK